MTEKECLNLINDLKMARNIYYKIINNEKSSLYQNDLIKDSINKVNFEIKCLESCIYNMECTDSYELAGISL